MTQCVKSSPMSNLKFNFKRSVSLLLILSQSGFAASALAASKSSPELQLVVGVLAMRGEALSESDQQTEVSALLSQYMSNASADGQTERMQQALIDLHISNAAQASEFVSQVESSATKITSNSSATQDELAKNISTEAVRLANLNPSGAQFSGCVMAMPFALGAFIAGISLAPVGAIRLNADENHQIGNPSGIHNDKVIMYTGIGLLVVSIAIIASPHTCAG
jgi:hypothetical protein